MVNRKNVWLLILSGVAIAVGVMFSILNWDVITYLFTQMTTGMEIVEDYIRGLGVMGIICISLIIIICFFVPVISSVPIQLASAVAYGLPFSTVHVLLSIVIASQLVYLFTKTFKIFSTKKQIEERKKLEEKIKNSKRSIFFFIILAYLAPFVPFFLIHMVAASSGMKWWKYSLVTLIGPIPDIIITLWAGVKITSGGQSPITSYVLLVVIVVCVILSMIYKNKIIDLIFTPKQKTKEKKEKVDESKE
ncbi:MAG: TVP38/TMEM64 family protein [Clostridia bacterium]|nr:TVP38/TMEM64 family protein [Clostridia bacterium]